MNNNNPKQIMVLTLKEICEAVESYWGRKKTSKQIKVELGMIPRFDVKSYAITDYVFQYEDLNP